MTGTRLGEMANEASVTDIAVLARAIKDLGERLTCLERRLGDDRKVAERVAQYTMQKVARE